MEVVDEEIAAAKPMAIAAKVTQLATIKSEFTAKGELSEEHKAILGPSMKVIGGKVSALQSYASMGINVGAFLGMYGLARCRNGLDANRCL